MPLQWDTLYAIDVPEIDQQHEEIFRRVGVLLTAMKAGKVGDELRELLAFLERYVVEHFEAEERLMAKHQWAGLPAHRELHRAFMRDFSGHKADFEQSGTTTSMVLTIATFVTSWLTAHIAVADRAFGRSLNPPRGKPPS